MVMLKKTNNADCRRNGKHTAVSIAKSDVLLTHLSTLIVSLDNIIITFYFHHNMATRRISHLTISIGQVFPPTQLFLKPVCSRLFDPLWPFKSTTTTLYFAP